MQNYVHQISPIALPLYGDVAIRWYGLAYLAGLILGLLLMRKMSHRGGNKLDKEELSDFVTWAALGVMIGGRLGYCIFYSPHLLTDFSSRFPFWGVLKVWEGGMASHGGILGVLIASFLFSRKYKKSWLHVNDLTVLGASLGFFFGRLANFINGELYGRVVEKPVSWAVKFPQELTEWTTYSQAKLLSLQPHLDSLSQIAGFPSHVESYKWADLVTRYTVDSGARHAVESLVVWLQNQAVEKNQVVVEVLSQVLPARYPSQLIQALCEGLIVFVVLNLIWLKPRKPGVLSAWFGILYSLARIFGEQFRMPDAQIGFQALGLTRGQWLSLAMLGLSLALLAYCSLRQADKIKGWSKG